MRLFGIVLDVGLNRKSFIFFVFLPIFILFLSCFFYMSHLLKIVIEPSGRVRYPLMKVVKIDFFPLIDCAASWTRDRSSNTHQRPDPIQG